MKLYAPYEYWLASHEDREKNCNGCGSGLDLSGKLVPNTMYGLDIVLACCIHDWMYKYGRTLGDKLFADSMFLLNMTIIILNRSGWFLKVPRLLRAGKYFAAVAAKGNESFFHEKRPNEDMSITFAGTFKSIGGEL